MGPNRTQYANCSREGGLAPFRPARRPAGRRRKLGASGRKRMRVGAGPVGRCRAFKTLYLHKLPEELVRDAYITDAGMREAFIGTSRKSLNMSPPTRPGNPDSEAALEASRSGFPGHASGTDNDPSAVWLPTGASAL
jgi:hypothetical protein